MAERVSGQQLDDLFDTWLFTAGKPAVATPAGLARDARSSAQRTSGRAATWLNGFERRLANGRY